MQTRRKVNEKTETGRDSEKHERVSKKEMSSSSKSEQGGKLEGRMKEQEAACQ